MMQLDYVVAHHDRRTKFIKNCGVLLGYENLLSWDSMNLQVLFKLFVRIDEVKSAQAFVQWDREFQQASCREFRLSTIGQSRSVGLKT